MPNSLDGSLLSRPGRHKICFNNFKRWANTLVYLISVPVRLLGINVWKTHFLHLLSVENSFSALSVENSFSALSVENKWAVCPSSTLIPPSTFIRYTRVCTYVLFFASFNHHCIGDFHGVPLAFWTLAE